MPIDITILEKEKLIIEKYTGRIGLDEIVSTKKALLNNPPPEKLSLIINVNGARLNLTHNDLEDLACFFLQYKDFIEGTRLAFVTDKPNAAAITYLYEYIVKEKNLGFEVNTFSSEEIARKWISE
jgi:hypothetical protein